MSGFRWGFNVNGARVGDIPYFLSFVERLQPDWMLIMSNDKLGEEILNVTGGQTQVINRTYSPKEGTQWQTMSPESYAAELMAGNRKHLWQYVLNEPNTANKVSEVLRRNNWIADVIEIMTDSGFKVVAGNLAAGSFESWHIDQGGYDRLLKVLSERREVAKFGIHEYTAIVLANGGGRWDIWNLLEREKVQPQYWPSLNHPNPDLRIGDYTKQFVPYLYHLFRSHWLQMRVINHLNIDPVEFIHTEFGWDRMPDISQGQNHIYDALEKKYGMDHPYRNLRGPYTHSKLWKYYWGNWSTADAILEQFKWSEENYNEWYGAFLPFMWSFGDNWDNVDGFNYGADRELHEKMIEWSKSIRNQEPSEPNPDPIPVPDPNPIPDPTPPPTDGEIVEDESNILNNPTLDGFYLQETVGEKVIEAPVGWEWVYYMREEDPDLVPSVYHRSPGMGVSGGYIKWQGGFEQRNVQFVKGQRYFARGIVENNFRIVGDGDFATDVEFRFTITNADDEVDASDWFTYDSEWQNRQIEMLWVFEPEISFKGAFKFECNTRWGNTDGEMKFVAIVLQRMASDYRNDVVQYIDFGQLPPYPDPDPTPDPEPEEPEMVDLLNYIRGDGRLYALRYEFPGGPGEGIQHVQTQIDGRRFFHTKGIVPHPADWEELWYDNDFIRRGTDISPGDDGDTGKYQLYQTFENGEYGQKWIPRFAKVGDKHLATPAVTFRYQSDGAMVPGKEPYVFPHWIEVKAIHPTFEFKSGIILNNVLELWGYLHDPQNNRPGENFEKYFYAVGYGLVRWDDPRKNWTSYISEPQVHGSLPRKVISWLPMPPLPPLVEPSEPNTFPLSDNRWKEIWLSSTDQVYGTNIRQQPSTSSPVIGFVLKDKPALLLKEEKRLKPDGIWYPVRVNTVATDNFDNGDFSNSGWIRQDVMTYKDRVVAPPDPDPPVSTDRYLDLYVEYDPNNNLHDKLVKSIVSIGDALDVSGANITMDEDEA